MKKMKQIPEEERPYEKCVRLGAEALTDAELLAVLLRTGTKGSPSVHMAEEVLNLSEKKKDFRASQLKSYPVKIRKRYRKGESSTD